MNDGLTILFTESSVSGIYETTMGSDLEVMAEKLDFSQLNEVQQKVLGEFEVGGIVDLSLVCNDQLIHELGGVAQVTIPCPEDGKWKVFYVSEDGNMEEMTVLQQTKDKIVIETNHFSAFALIRQNEDVVDSAQQGGVGWIVAVIVIIVVLGGSTAAFVILKKKNLLPWFKK